MAYGIDLGTTYSAIASMQDGKPELIPNSLGDVLTPSVVGIDSNGLFVVGKAARELATTQPESVAAVFKRHVGSDWSVRLGGRNRSATELSAILLSQIRQDAEKVLGESIEEVVITVPAYFNDAQRSATIEAGHAAGLEVLRVINEPTAAAIAYGLHEIDEERTTAVIDLGGGTFDVSIVDQYESVVEIKASAGEVFLGGEDFTSALVTQLFRQRGESFEVSELKHPKRVARVKHICERLKRELSEHDSVSFKWPDDDGSINQDDPEISVTREEFNEWTAPILSRITRPLRRAISDSGMSPDELDQIILVGGATRMPCLIELVTNLFGKPPKYSLPPDTVVAMGAAVQAGLIGKQEGLGELVVTDVAPFTLGIETTRKIGNQLRDGYFSSIISRNTPLPTSRFNRVSTISPNQTQVRVAIYQGEGRRVEDNLLLGEFTIDGIPPGPPGQEVDIRFSYDLNGLLEAEATVVKTGTKRSLVISRLSKKSMSAAEIQAAVEKMQSLKVEWKDRPENKLLLNQAERMYSELSLVDREQLDDLLTAFEHALAEQDAALVEAMQTQLGIFLSSRDRELDWDGRDYGTEAED